MSEELKPCPFCGGIGKVHAKKKDDIGLTIWCECEKCHAKTQGYCPNVEHEECALDNIEYGKNKAINSWNRRMNYDVDKVVEQLENERKFWENAYDSNLGKEKARSYEHAIEIVKGGGVDG